MVMNSAVELAERHEFAGKRSRNALQHRIDRLVGEKYRLLEARAGLVETLNALEAENAVLKDGLERYKDGLERSLRLIDRFRDRANAARMPEGRMNG